MNKSDGTAIHSIGGRTVYYHFKYPGVRRISEFTDAPYNVLLLGDSFTFGWGLSAEETYAANLERRVREAGLTQLRFVNAAAGGWGLDSYMRYVEEFGDIIKPCAIIIFLNTDDVGRAVKNGLYELRDGLLVGIHKEPPLLKAVLEKVPWYEFLLERSHLISLVRKAFLALQSENIAGGDGLMDLTRGPASMDVKDVEHAARLAFALSARLIEWVRMKGVDLLIVTTGWHRPPYDDSEPTRAFLLQAGAWFAQRGIAFEDVSPVVQERLAENGSRSVIPGDGHPSVVGAAIIADAVWPAVHRFLVNTQCVVSEARKDGRAY